MKNAIKFFLFYSGIIIFIAIFSTIWSLYFRGIFNLWTQNDSFSINYFISYFSIIGMLCGMLKISKLFVTHYINKFLI